MTEIERDLRDVEEEIITMERELFEKKAYRRHLIDALAEEKANHPQQKLFDA